MSEKLGLGSRFLSMLVETEGDKKPPVPVQQTSNSQATTQSTSAPVVVGYDADMLATLQKIISARKTPYTALIEASETMKAVIPDDLTRMKAAFAMIAADGQRNLGTITQALDVHIQDLNGELMRFKQTSDAAVTTKVESLRASAKNLTSNCESRLQQIASLEAQIESLRKANVDDANQSAELTNKAASAAADIATTTSQFTAVVEFLKNDLTNKKSQLASALTV